MNQNNDIISDFMINKLIIGKAMLYFELEHPDRAKDLQIFLNDREVLELKDFVDQLSIDEFKYFVGCVLSVFQEESDNSRAA